MISITLAGADALVARLEGLEQALGNLAPAWRGPVHDIFVRFITVHFTSQGKYSGEVWRPLSPRYLAWKERHYPGMGILRRTDRLYKSLTETGGEHILRVYPDAVEMGTRVLYAVYHQARDRGKARFPRRLVIPPLTRAEGARIADALLAFLLAGMRRKKTTGAG